MDNKIDIDKLKVLLYVKDKFLATLAFYTPVQVKESGDFIAYTNGISVTFNQDRMSKFTTKEQLAVYAHELIHIVLMHAARFKEIPDANSSIYNEACDYVVNHALKDYSLPDGALVMPKEYEKYSTEEIYHELLKNLQHGEEQKPDNLKHEGSSYYSDGGDLSTENEGEKALDKETITNNVKKLIATAKAVCKKDVDGFSNRCSEFGRVVEKLFDSKLPWELILRNYVNEVFPDDYSWSRPNRRYQDIYLPSISFGEALKSINVYIDVSGSVRDDLVAKFLSELKKLHEDMGIDIMRIKPFSIGIGQEIVITDNWQQPKQLQSGGGTEIESVFKDIDEQKPVVSLIFTDGEFASAEPPRYPVIWLIYENKMFTHNKDAVILVDDI